MTAQDLFEQLGRMTFKERKAYILYASRLRPDGKPGWNDPIVGLLPESEIVLCVCYSTALPKDGHDGQ